MFIWLPEKINLHYKKNYTRDRFRTFKSKNNFIKVLEDIKDTYQQSPKNLYVGMMPTCTFYTNETLETPARCSSKPFFVSTNGYILNSTLKYAKYNKNANLHL